jgi:hypothetical protein
LPDVERLTDVEISKLAVDVANRIMEIKEKSYLIQYGPFTEYLRYMESDKLTKRESVKLVLEEWSQNQDNLERLAASFNSWMKKNAAKADLKTA